VVVMYADNVLKGFATSFSVVLSYLISAYTFEHAHMTSTSLLGAIIVVSSALVYSLFPSQAVPVSVVVGWRPTGAGVLDNIKDIESSPQTPFASDDSSIQQLLPNNSPKSL
jgi:hypothetical protein